MRSKKRDVRMCDKGGEEEEEMWGGGGMSVSSDVTSGRNRRRAWRHDTGEA